jgi:hypothetical protein
MKFNDLDLNGDYIGKTTVVTRVKVLHKFSKTEANELAREQTRIDKETRLLPCAWLCKKCRGGCFCIWSVVILAATVFTMVKDVGVAELTKLAYEDLYLQQR